MKRKILEDIHDKAEIRRSIEEQLRRQRAQQAARAARDGRPRVDINLPDYDPLLEILKNGKR